MRSKNKKILTGLLGLVSASTLVIGVAQADNRGGTAPGYVLDSTGDIVRDRSDCTRSSDWTEADKTIVGCDGVVLDAPVEVVIGQGTGIFADVNIPAASMFAFDKSDLSAKGKASIDEYRATLGPEFTNAYLVVVAGHTDSSGDPTYNMGLSLRRAQSVADYLVETGVPAEKIRVIGRGANEPLVSNATLDGRMQNRRVDILAVAEVRALDSMMFPSVALFERRSGSLTEQGKAVIEKHRVEAKDILSRASFVEIVGHTDDVDTDDYNMKLSIQRANSVRDYLVSKGLDASKVVTTGKGESMPIASNKTEEGRAQNRRVEVLILGRIKE